MKCRLWSRDSDSKVGTELTVRGAERMLSTRLMAKMIQQEVSLSKMSSTANRF